MYLGTDYLLIHQSKSHQYLDSVQQQHNQVQFQTVLGYIYLQKQQVLTNTDLERMNLHCYLTQQP